MNKKAKVTIWLSSFFALVILTASIYVLIPDKVKIVVENTNTKFYVYEDEWVLGATEYMYLYDGTTKMRAKSRNVTSKTIGDFTIIMREAFYKDDISTVQVYTFDSTIEDIELIPISHEASCFNCQGKIVNFEYRDITYDGITQFVESPQEYGHQMKIEWQEGSYYSKVFQQIVADKLIVKYRPQLEIETYLIRMFDPELSDSILIGDKIVKELCDIVNKTWIDEIPHYKTCYWYSSFANTTKDGIYLNKTTGEYYDIIDVPHPYKCEDYIEKIEHINETVDCIKNGKVQVNEKIIEHKDFAFRLEGNKICGYSNRDAGINAMIVTDDRYTRICQDLITGEKILPNPSLVSSMPVLDIK